jgi:hypothetical protein
MANEARAINRCTGSQPETVLRGNEAIPNRRVCTRDEVHCRNVACDTYRETACRAGSVAAPEPSGYCAPELTGRPVDDRADRVLPPSRNTRGLSTTLFQATTTGGFRGFVDDV